MTDGVELAASAASPSPLADLRSGSLAAYWRFHRAVARAQLTAWLPAAGKLLVDISGRSANGAAQAAASGHDVVSAVPPYAGLPVPGAPGAGAADAVPAPAVMARRGGPPGRLVRVVADPGALAFLADSCADGVIAEDGALSRQLMAEDLAAEITRVLRPGGELFACVDSLVLGMAMLAEQHQWAHLTDLPNAEVVLIPWPDGTITRCFGTTQLKDLLTEAGLEVGWIRPRTVLSPSMVDHVLQRDAGAMARLVRAELHAWQDPYASAGTDEAFGISLIARARKPL
jgi:hypothetical protein